MLVVKAVNISFRRYLILVGDVLTVDTVGCTVEAFVLDGSEVVLLSR